MINIGIDIDEVALRYVDRLAEVFFLFGGETDISKPKEYSMDYFVDDKRETCLEIAANGIFVFTPKRSWNTLPPTENIYQYVNAFEIVRWFN